MEAGLDDKVQDEGLNDVEWMLWFDDEDEVAFLDNYRRGLSLLTLMATHAGVGLVALHEVVEVGVFQNGEDQRDVVENPEAENDVVECLEDDFVMVDPSQDDADEANVVDDVPVQG